MQTYTVFCQDEDGGGTTWISGDIEADSVEAAKHAALNECANDWEYDSIESIRVLGVAEGSVNIVEWSDIDDLCN